MILSVILCFDLLFIPMICGHQIFSEHAPDILGMSDPSKPKEIKTTKRRPPKPKQKPEHVAIDVDPADKNTSKVKGQPKKQKQTKALSDHPDEEVKVKKVKKPKPPPPSPDSSSEEVKVKKKSKKVNKESQTPPHSKEQSTSTPHPPGRKSLSTGADPLHSPKPTPKSEAKKSITKATPSTENHYERTEDGRHHYHHHHNQPHHEHEHHRDPETGELLDKHSVDGDSSKKKSRSRSRNSDGTTHAPMQEAALAKGAAKKWGSFAKKKGTRTVHPETTKASDKEPGKRPGSFRNPNEHHDPKSVSLQEKPAPNRDNKKNIHHHNEFVNQLLRDAKDTTSRYGSEELRRARRRETKAGKLGSVFRIRDGGNTYNLRKVGANAHGDPEDPMDDPLLYNNIMKSDNFKDWKRGAHLALPSNIGVPIESGNDAVDLGVSVKQQRAGGAYDRKNAYNSLYNDMEKRFSNEGIEAGRHSHPRAGIRQSLGTTNLGHQGRVSDEIKGPITYARKLKAIRELADHMDDKRYYKSELLKQGVEEGDSLPNKRTWKDAIQMTVIKLHNRMRHNFRRLALWQNDLRFIHGRYGIGAATYFSWLRIVVSMNIIQTILVLGFIVIPEMAASKNQTAAILTTCPSNIASIKTCAVIPEARITPSYGFFDPFTGRGSLKNSYLYYSGYEDTLADPFCPSHELDLGDTPKPNIMKVTAFRFFLIIFIMFILNSTFLAIKIKQYYQTAELESKIPGLHKKQRFRSFFSSWDFSVIHPETALVLHRNIWRGFTDALSEKEEGILSKKAVAADRPFLERKLEVMLGYQKAVIAVHVLMTLLLLIIYTAAGYAMWMSLQVRMEYKKTEKEKLLCNQFNSIPDILLVLPTFVMSILYLFVGVFSAFIAQFESWGSPVSKNFAFIFRVGIYYCMTIGVIYAFFLYQAKESIQDLLCYEDFFGHEIYRLVVLQAFLYLSVTFLASNFYSFMNRKNSSYQKPQFDPVNYTMRAFYLHTISGIGFFYCPLVSLLVLIRQVITFYHHKRMLKHFYRLSAKIIQTSDVYPPFLLAFLLSYLTTTLMNLMLFELNPSIVCGPFSHYGEAIRLEGGELAHYYQVFVDGFASSDDIVVRVFISPGFAFMLIVFLLAMLYTIRSWGMGYLHTIEELYHFLQLERKDRDFLLEAIYHFAKRRSKELQMAEKIANKGADDSDEDLRHSHSHLDPFVEETIFEGIFQHRRGAMATLEPIRRASVATKRAKKADRAHEPEPEPSPLPHGTMKSQVKEDFDWLPSQWHRRGRRSAVIDVEMEPEQAVKLRKRYSKVLRKGQDVGTEDYDYASASTRKKKPKNAKSKKPSSASVGSNPGGSKNKNKNKK